MEVDGQGGEDDVEVQGGGRGQGVQLQVQDQLNLFHKYSMNHCELISFLKNTIFFYL